MRQIFVQVPRSQGHQAKQIIEQYHPVNFTQINAQDDTEETLVFIASVSNQKIDGLFEALNEIPQTRITLIPGGVLAFHLDTPEIADQVTDVELLSPIEVFLSGLQSIGSWKGFLGYALAAGVLVWLGLFINSVVLLVAGMLVAPLAGPAMNLAIAIARGDIKLLKHSLARYIVAIIAVIFVSVILTLATGLNVITQQMDSMSQISDLTVLIPLVIGVGGALSLIQSGSSSLVSGTVSGLLIAASLAPPVSLIGIGGVLGEWNIVRTAVFIVMLQLVGINLAGTVILRLNNMQSQSAHYNRGKKWLFSVGLGLNIIILIGLLFWQQSNPPDLQRASIAQEAANDIRQVIDENAQVDLIEMQTRFTRTDIQGQNSLLIVLYVQPHSDTLFSHDEIRTELRESISNRLNREGYNVTPLLDISILSPP